MKNAPKGSKRYDATLDPLDRSIGSVATIKLYDPNGAKVPPCVNCGHWHFVLGQVPVRADNKTPCGAGIEFGSRGGITQTCECPEYVAPMANEDSIHSPPMNPRENLP